jgi:uncharacterized protein (TIGR03792 family)
MAVEELAVGAQVGDGMVVEELEVDVAPDDVEGFLAADAEVWTAFLRDQAGFVRKEVWADPERPGVLRLVIWWASREAWKRITDAEVRAVDARMGPWLRLPRMREYRVLVR